jgi:hypothetical protein
MGKSAKIIKIKHEADFTIIGNSALQDSSLSWAARGLLAYMLSLPSDWDIHENELLAHTTDKKLATHNAMEELIRDGYVFKRQGKDFRNETDFFVSDSKTTKDLSENQTSPYLKISNYKVNIYKETRKRNKERRGKKKPLPLQMIF